MEKPRDEQLDEKSARQRKLDLHYPRNAFLPLGPSEKPKRHRDVAVNVGAGVSTTQWRGRVSAVRARCLAGGGVRHPEE